MTGLLQRFKHSAERAGITTEVVTGEFGAVAAIAALVEPLKAARVTAHPSGRRA